MANETVCLICNFPLKEKPTVNVSAKGIRNLLRFSVQREDGLITKLKDLESVTLHADCRRSYIRRIKPSENVRVSPGSASPKAKILRSSLTNFDFQTHCIFCGASAPSASSNVSTVQFTDTKEKVLALCQKRADSWASKVRIRMSGCQDLVHGKARYHRSCYQKFCDPKKSEGYTSVSFMSATSLASGSFAMNQQSPKYQVGRPIDHDKSEAFEALCVFLDNADECQFTLAELVQKISSPESQIYSEKHLERLLKVKYQSRIHVTDRPGKSSILCFKGAAWDALSKQFYAGKQCDESKEQERIVKAAAEIVLADIKSRAYELDTYPTIQEIETGSPELVPPSLRLFLGTLFKSKKSSYTASAKINRKSTALSHAIVAAVRPKSFISPVLLGLSLYLHRTFGSRALLDILHNLGLSASYSETMNFEKVLTIHSSSRDILDGAFVQPIFDNFDFNTRTLDGNNTCHVMGGLLCVTPASALAVETALPRKLSRETPPDFRPLAQIPLKIYRQPQTSGLQILQVLDLRPGVEVFASISQVEADLKAANALRLDRLWLAGKTSHPLEIPGWIAFMQVVTESPCDTYDVSTTLPLPFANMKASNPSTIFSCILYSLQICRERNISACVVTFDQQLFLPAVKIVLSADADSILKSVVVRLGGFHLVMSFLGAMGHIMHGSGIEAAWETVYAKNVVNHMISGHAYSRALRAHFLTQTSLLKILANSVVSMENAAFLCLSVFRKTTPVADATKDSDLVEFSVALDAVLEEKSSSSRTGKLWVMYIKMVDLVRQLIRAERTGDWTLHLTTIRKMLVYFHAGGHYNYAKSTHIYLQLMEKLEERMPPGEFEAFTRKGYFTIRRSDKFWSGTFTDMVIEQDLMRRMKKHGGLTTGRGLSDSTIAVWVQSMPACTKIIETVENFSGTRAVTSEQHVEMRESRIATDNKHMAIFDSWFQLHPPFEKPPDQLVCLSSGVVADTTVNCDSVFELGSDSMKSMCGKNFDEVTISRKYRVVPLSAMARSVNIRGAKVQVNATQLFHRIVLITKTDEELRQCFCYELAPRPTSMFDDDGMRKGTKSKLVDSLETVCGAKSDTILPVNPTYVVDGGFILRKVVWPRPAKYEDVLAAYAAYVLSHYGTDAVVGFDGYPDRPTTKDPEHTRRTAKTYCTDIHFEPEMIVSSPQDKFFSNSANKTRLIAYLMQKLQACGVTLVFQCEADADVSLVQRAIQIASAGSPTVVVGTDTDLLVLLIGLTISSPALSLHFLIPGTGGKPFRVYHISDIHMALGDIAKHIFFLHAMTGWDSTSAFYGKAKKRALQIVATDEEIRTSLEVFNRSDAQPSEVSAAGEKFVLTLYGQKKLANLNTARFVLYQKTIVRQSVKSKFELATLPPTSDSCKQHSNRVYHQVQDWHGKYTDPLMWGWKNISGKLQPIEMTLAPAPDALLNIISCNCKSGCTSRCECLSSGLRCSAICGHCAGIACTNAMEIPDDVETDEDDPYESENLDVILA